jgi:putative membrane protein
VVELIVKILINAAALAVAVILLPQVELDLDDWPQLLLVAAIFAIVNSYIGPIVKALTLPISLLTLGLISFVINAALFLLVAWVAGAIDIPFTVGGFPPDLDSDAIIGALLGSIIVSIVSTALGLLNFGRRLAGIG